MSRGVTLACFKAAEGAGSKRGVKDMEKISYDGGRDGLKERRGVWIKGTGGGAMRENEVRDLCLGQGRERV